MTRIAGRPGAALTRRDVALALLSEPARSALADLPGLRRELVVAGNPLSLDFWDSATAILMSIQRGAATVGQVKSWLESTGTEPLDLPELGFFWADKSEAGPVTTDLHAQLVSHLESLVAEGTTDADALATGDAAALAAHRQHQVEWLTTPRADGQTPFDAIIAEEEDAFFALWDDAERDAWKILGELLDELGDRPCPAAELHAAAARLREELGNDHSGTALLRAAAGVDPGDLPQDDAELWLTLAAGVVAQQDEPPRDEYDVEVLSAWGSLGHADWTAAAIILARRGPGYEVDVDDLAALIVTYDFEAMEDEDLTAEDDPGWDDGDLDDGESASVVGLGLFPVLRLWQQLGALDHDDRLTGLGWWGIPESLRRAWQPDRPSEQDSPSS